MTPPPYPHERFNTVPDASDGLLRNGRRLSDEVFDFGLGDEAYKARFASETRQVFNIPDSTVFYVREWNPCKDAEICRLWSHWFS
jgi:hypothetical protein